MGKVVVDDRLALATNPENL